MVIDVTAYQPGEHLEAVSDDIWKLLCIVDEFFVPTLSQRSDIALSHLKPQVLSPESLWGGPVSYFEAVMQHNIALARIEGTVVGIVAWSDQVVDPLIEDRFNPHFRVMTVATHPDYMKQGVGKALITNVLKHAKSSSTKWTIARYWRGGAAVPMLERMGFERISVIANHRGPGIDTIYFGLADNSLF